MNRGSGCAVAIAFALAALAQAAEPESGGPSEPAAKSAAAATQEQPRSERRRGIREKTPEPTTTAAAAVSPLERQEIAAEAKAEPAVVCRMMRPTGTRVKRRACGTAEEWATNEGRHADAAQETMRQVRDRSTIVVAQPENPLSPAR